MLFITFHVMPRVKIHIDNAEGLVTAYGAASANARETMVALSPLVTRAYDLLGMAGQNGLTGPMPALMNLANDLRTEVDDVAWRVDWLKTTDALPLGLSGRVTGEVPADLDAAFRASGLTDEQIELANQMMRDGVSFTDAAAAAQSDDPQAELAAGTSLDDALTLATGRVAGIGRLVELNRLIDGWEGTDNDIELDLLVRERDALLVSLTGVENSWDVDPDVAAYALTNGLSIEQAELEQHAGSIDQLHAQLAATPNRVGNHTYIDLQAQLEDEVLALAGGDPQIAAYIMAGLNQGLPASEAFALAQDRGDQAELRRQSIQGTAEALGIPEDYAEWLVDELNVAPGEIVVGVGGLDLSREDIQYLIENTPAEFQFEGFMEALAATAVTETQLEELQASETSAVNAHRAWAAGQPIDTADLAAHNLTLETSGVEGYGTWYVIRNHLGIAIAAWYDNPGPANAFRNMTLAESTAAYRRTASPSDEDETYQSYLDSGDYGETDAAAFAFSMHGDADQADDVRTGAWPGNYTGAVYESALTDPHIWLDGLGLVPLVGEAADGLNAALYLVEGDFTNASISVVSMVPYLGSLGPARRVANNVGGEVVSSMQVVDGGQVLHTIRQADGSLIQVVELTDGQLLGGPSTLIRGDVSGAASPPNAIVDPPLTAAQSSPSPLRPDDDLIDAPQATAGATPPRPDDDLIDLNNPNREPALVGANTSPDVGASANASDRTPVGTGGSGNSGSGSGSSGGSGSGNGGDGPDIGGSGADDFGNGSDLDGYDDVGSARGDGPAPTGLDTSNIPPGELDKAEDIAQRAFDGSAPPAGVRPNGRTFRNDGRGGGQVLPQQGPDGSSISYREWDVNPPGPSGRDAVRVVTGSDGSAWYTSDHYNTFTRIR